VSKDRSAGDPQITRQTIVAVGLLLVLVFACLFGPCEKENVYVEVQATREVPVISVVTATPKSAKQSATPEPTKTPRAVPMCGIDDIDPEDPLDNYLGNYVTVKDYGERWIALEMPSGQTSCFPNPPLDSWKSEPGGVHFNGYSVDEESRLSRRDWGWNGEIRGRRGTLTKEDGVFVLKGDRIHGINDEIVREKCGVWYMELERATGYYFSDWWFSWIRGENQTAGDVCEEISLWQYLVPVPEGLPEQCSYGEDDPDWRWGARSWQYWGIVGGDTVLYTYLIPTQSELETVPVLGAETEFALVGCEQRESSWGIEELNHPLDLNVEYKRKRITIKAPARGLLAFDVGGERYMYIVPTGCSK